METVNNHKRYLESISQNNTLLIGLLFFSLVGWGQIQTPQNPIFQNSLPQNPEPQTINNDNHSIHKDKLTEIESQQHDKQKQLEEIYREIAEPKTNTTSSGVKYDLPTCASLPGASAYRSAFSLLMDMAAGKRPFNIKEANFTVENAFYENTKSYKNFDLTIKQIGRFLLEKMDELKYDKNSNLTKNLILFRLFSDTLEIKSKGLKHYPSKYDFEDYAGNDDWSKMFVLKLLATNSGQCHSLPLLYLILAEEIGAKAQLAYSPNHIYIKFRDDDGKWQNIELTNGMLTTDAFMVKSGYIKAEAIQNKIYIQPLTERQLLSNCLFDLAKGYTVKFCYDAFVETVIEKALGLDPININAQMLKSDYLTVRFRYIENQLGINVQNYREKLAQYPKAKEIFLARNGQYAKIDNLGYENMPAEAYERWLRSLGEAKRKQESQELFLGLDKKIEMKNIETGR